MIELITNEEKQMIEYYRRNYALDGDEPRCSCEEYLKVWEREKENLFHTFGDKLFYSFPINIGKPAIEIKDEMVDKILHHPYLEFLRQWGRSHRVNLWDITSIELDSYLMNKKLPIGYSIPKLNLKFQKGTKIITIFKKVNKAIEYDDEETFNDFINKYSSCFTSATTTGTFYLSIHPLDYMTMSDNGGNWTSCMSWDDYGCYRRGTVEMMDSPMVVVGYLASDHETLKIGGNIWNSKKWRTLYVVDDDIITSIKSYPYADENLEKAGLEKLRQLAGAERYEEKVNSSSDSHFLINSEKDIRFNTNAMYNDFGRTIHHFVVGKNIMDMPKKYKYINYSGPAVCACCGAEDPSDWSGVCSNGSSEEESWLVCDYCYPDRRCDCCDCSIYNDNYYETEDGIVCESCFYDNYIYCPISDTYAHYDNVEYVYISKIVPETGEYKITNARIPVSDIDDIAYWAFKEPIKYEYQPSWSSYITRVIYHVPLDEFKDRYQDDIKNQYSYDLGIECNEL